MGSRDRFTVAGQADGQRFERFVAGGDEVNGPTGAVATVVRNSPTTHGRNDPGPYNRGFDAARRAYDGQKAMLAQVVYQFGR